KIKEHCEKADKKFFENSEEWFKKWMKHRRISPEKKFILNAPSLIVVAGEQDKPYWLESTWISIAYMTLAIENEGLKSLTYTPGEVGFLNEILEIPSNLKPVVILPIGYPKGK
ncbi:MAG: nitroreductase family protein, partial [Candidatus Thermoplasmatota archaeon]|nr:nitroreductase family protein [Candidatus Thermoplasmatota archaeon]